MGSERRPVVDAVIRLAGKSISSQINVNDRSRRSAQVLLGRADVKGFHVRLGLVRDRRPAAVIWAGSHEAR